ncbi:MAG: radical SAM protein [Candidatus Thermoplasmatota archaeon]|uniref:Radical SAM protein n=1 Tax=Candidatus Sysuiplasma superficiale TaxID=2823368 RepID=A0A8J8CCJ6_9ARCH|nr:radical SAM protein [Candidatus Sysuiplasma superficiale]MCL4347337.1 radical SAM protein [Candidatus Thermoplasmatota archaeon]
MAESSGGVAASATVSAPSPYVVVWESTKACDFSCRHCRAEAQTNRSPLELTTEEARRLADDVAASGARLFVISGGDPLKRDDIFEILKYSAGRIATAFSPSGAYVDRECALKIADAGIRNVSISLDGPMEIHDAFRGIRGSYARAVSAINNLRDAGLSVQINTTVSAFNYSSLHSFMETVLSLSPSVWDIFMLVPTGRATAEMMIEPEQAEELMHQVAEWRSQGISVRMTCAPYLVRVQNEMGNRPLRPDSYGRKSMNGARGCMAGNGYVFIASDGSVRPCGYLPVVIGNVRFSSLIDIYRSERMSVFRDPALLGGKCGACEYRTVCGGCRARAYSSAGNALSQDSFCVHEPQAMRGWGK